MSSEHDSGVSRTPRYLILGLLTVAPLWVTWLVFEFVFTQLSALGGPWVALLTDALAARFPDIETLRAPSFQAAIAVVLTLVVLIAIGWLAGNIIGQRIIHQLERLVLNVPLVAAIYGGTKRFLAAMKEKPGGLQRVVLISFPTDNMKAVGLVTKVIRDIETGRELAVVYVPTAPNPTSGYIEIVPIERVVSTNWTIDEAMAFVMTGGVTSPEQVHFRAAGATRDSDAQ